jgi:hypothetical protein
VTGLDYEHVSHSQLGDWLRCQKQFQLKRIQRAPKVPAWWLVGGSTIHEVTEDLDKRSVEFSVSPADQDVTLEIEELTLGKLDELTAREVERSGVPHDQWFSAGNGKGQNYDWWKENAPKQVSNYLQWRARTGWKFATFYDDLPGLGLVEFPAIECDFHVTLEINGEQRPLIAIPDRVFTLPDGDLVVTDLKSGASTPEELLQQGLYASVIEMSGHQRPAFGTFVKTKTGEHTPLRPLDKYTLPYLEQRFTGFRAQLESVLENQAFIPNVGDACRTCPVAGACYAQDGANSALWDPSDPNYKEGSK